MEYMYEMLSDDDDSDDDFSMVNIEWPYAALFIILIKTTFFNSF